MTIKDLENDKTKKKKTETLYIRASRKRSKSLVYDYRTNGKCKTIYQQGSERRKTTLPFLNTNTRQLSGYSPTGGNPDKEAHCNRWVFYVKENHLCGGIPVHVSYWFLYTITNQTRYLHKAKLFKLKVSVNT